MGLLIRQSHKQGDYSIFEFDAQEPLAYARGTATATVRERLNTQAENALNKSPHTMFNPKPGLTKACLPKFAVQ
jgi:hypothetical protein